MRKFLIKWRSWEYWPVWVVYFVIFFAWLWYSLRLRSFLFFTTVNPTIEMGGMMGESKIKILAQIPQQYKPQEFFVEANHPEDSLVRELTTQQINFPVIAKPDVGERGFQVQICSNIEELKTYHQAAKHAYIIQEYIDFEEEYSVLYYRYPETARGEVSSLCKKEYLSVTGDGKSNLEDLLTQYDRAFLQLDRLKKAGKLDFTEVIPNGQKRVISTIGNHSKGTMFLDYNYEIDQDLKDTFDEIFKEIPEIHFGRADLKCTSLTDLKQGKNIRILEINGVSAEPAHIYDPHYSFTKATRDLLNQWKVLFEISRIQINRGISPMSIKGLITYVREYRKKINEKG